MASALELLKALETALQAVAVTPPPAMTEASSASMVPPGQLTRDRQRSWRAPLTIGFIGMPVVEHGNIFGEYLAPLFPHAEHAAASESHAAELLAMVVSVAIAVAGWRLASGWYKTGTDWPDRAANRFKGVYNLLLNKYKVDEIYNAIFVNGLVHKMAKFLHSVGDVKIIDGFINGLASAIGSTETMQAFMRM